MVTVSKEVVHEYSRTAPSPCGYVTIPAVEALGNECPAPCSRWPAFVAESDGIQPGAIPVPSA